MKTDPFETLLRQPISKETPRPGFETRLKALAAETSSPSTVLSPSQPRWILALTAIILVLSFFLVSKKEEAAPNNDLAIETPMPPTPQDSLVLVKNTPLHQEMHALQSDAEKTVRFLAGRFPKISHTF